jgi:hypothetical protein
VPKNSYQHRPHRRWKSPLLGAEIEAAVEDFLGFVVAHRFPFEQLKQAVVFSDENSQSLRLSYELLKERVVEILM